MNEQERRFKIISKESYIEEMSKERKNTIIYSCNIGLETLIAIKFLSSPVSNVNLMAGAVWLMSAYISLKLLQRSKRREEEINDIIKRYENNNEFSEDKQKVKKL